MHLIYAISKKKTFQIKLLNFKFLDESQSWLVLGMLRLNKLCETLGKNWKYGENENVISELWKRYIRVPFGPVEFLRCKIRCKLVCKMKIVREVGHTEWDCQVEEKQTVIVGLFSLREKAPTRNNQRRHPRGSEKSFPSQKTSKQKLQDSFRNLILKNSSVSRLIPKKNEWPCCMQAKRALFLLKIEGGDFGF